MKVPATWLTLNTVTSSADPVPPLKFKMVPSMIPEREAGVTVTPFPAVIVAADVVETLEPRGLAVSTAPVMRKGWNAGKLSYLLRGMLQSFYFSYAVCSMVRCDGQAWQVSSTPVLITRERAPYARLQQHRSRPACPLMSRESAS